MHLSTNITQIASTPPWAHVTRLPDGTEGYFVDTNLGDKVFLRKQDQVIWLPKTLRGRKVQDLMPDDLKNLPTEDKGKTHYKSWRAQNDAEQALSKIHNGYSFQPQGQALLARLTKLIEKYELDNTGNLGIDPKYSISPELINRMMQANNRDDVARLGRVIGKKFATIIHLLNQVNPKIAKRLDADFMFAYKPLMALFNFDPTEFQPNIPQPADENDPLTVTHVMVISLQNALKEIRPLLAQDMIFYPALQGLTKMLATMKQGVTPENIGQFQDLYTDLISQIVAQMQAQPTNEAFGPNPAMIAQQVVNSPALLDFHSLLFA